LTRDGVVVPWTMRGWQRPALLALLAAAGKRGIDRALLAATLWPDSPDAAARHSLDELLSRTRRELGEKELFVGTMTVALNAAVVAADIAAFESAIASSRLAAAVEIYQGPFAVGLRTGDSPELEQRLLSVRAHFAAEFRRAVETLTSEAGRRGHHRDAVHWWAKLVRVEADNTAVILRFIELLVRAGDTDRALSVARAEKQRCEQDGDPADPAIEAWIKRLEKGAIKDIFDEVAPTEPSRVVSIITRALGSDYRLGPLRDEGSLELVFEGTKVATAAPVEVRMIQPRVAAGTDPSAFAHAMERAASVVHPGVVPVLAVRATADALVTVTARRPAETLKQRMKQGAARIPDVIAVGLQLAESLAAAHEREVVHGMLRPRLIGFARDHVEIISLGLGQALLSRRPSDERSTVVSLGSPRYQSPEQLTGAVALDEASDLYTLGVMLYEWVTGQPCFPDSGDGVLKKLREAPPPARSVRPTIPAALDAIIMQCVAPHAADRPGSAMEAARAFAQLA
ncbi:MAG: protein kinase, partial [Gemmatimonadetes bacterium]|nr:protein kinase [Gemmatimonadota bacterium]